MIIPGGTWHNVINSSTPPLGLYSVYAPVEREPGAVHLTKADADAAEKPSLLGAEPAAESSVELRAPVAEGVVAGADPLVQGGLQIKFGGQHGGNA